MVYKLAPQVGECFILSDELHSLDIIQWKSPLHTEAPLIYGYMTQCADTSKTIKLEDKREVIQKVKSIPELQMPDPFDDQDDNFGYIADQLVFIDCDYGSWN